MRLEVHILSWDGERMIEWALRHYKALGARVIVHDSGVFQKSSVLAHFHGQEARPWDTGNKLDDAKARTLKNTCWKGTLADWVACVDADELLWFPGGIQATLESYENRKAAIVRPEGFEMFAEEFPDPAEDRDAQITDLVKWGAPADRWYGKPVLFSPRRLWETNFNVGAHDATPVASNGMRFKVDASWPHIEPKTYLLHYHHLGSKELVAQRYDETRERLSDDNVLHGWGNFEPGLKHVQDKRAQIIPNLMRVIG